MKIITVELLDEYQCGRLLLAVDSIKDIAHAINSNEYFPDISETISFSIWKDGEVVFNRTISGALEKELTNNDIIKIFGDNA